MLHNLVHCHNHEASLVLFAGEVQLELIVKFSFVAEFRVFVHSYNYKIGECMI